MIGKSVSRLEDAPMLVGAGQFVDDILLPGTLHAGFLRSSYGHAVIKRFDAGIAKSMVGVVAVYRFANIKPFLSEERLVVALPSKAFRQQVHRPVLASVVPAIPGRADQPARKGGRGAGEGGGQDCPPL